jgi:hypothetical protein
VRVAPSLIGITLDAFEIEALLSSGMATVYYACCRLFRCRSLHQEARLIASLGHPHIGPAYAFGEHAGAPFMI